VKCKSVLGRNKSRCRQGQADALNVHHNSDNLDQLNHCKILSNKMSNKEIKAEDFILVEKDEERIEDSVVKRENVVTEFKVGDILGHKKDLEKMQAELSGQVTVCNATIDNIKRNHDFVNELTDEQKHHVWMLYENQDVLAKAQDKLTQVEEQMEQYDEVINVITDHLGLELTDTHDEQNESSK